MKVMAEVTIRIEAPAREAADLLDELRRAGSANPALRQPCIRDLMEGLARHLGTSEEEA